MKGDYIPTKEAEQIPWLQNLSSKLSSRPADFGVPVALATQLAEMLDELMVVWELCNNPDTRSHTAIVRKRTLKAAVIKEARILSQLVQKTPGMDNYRRAELGLTEYKPEPTNVNPPTEKVQVDVKSRDGTDVVFRAHAGSLHRGRPAGCSGVMVYTHVGPTPPPTLDGWTFAGMHSRTLVSLSFDPTLPAGTIVWISAYWVNNKGQTGPGNAATSVVLAGGAMPQAA